MVPSRMWELWCESVCMCVSNEYMSTEEDIKKVSIQTVLQSYFDFDHIINVPFDRTFATGTRLKISECSN